MRQVARKVELNSTFGNGCCNLSRNDFGRFRVCYTVKYFMQLVSPQCRQNIAKQVARNISQCNSALGSLRNDDGYGNDNAKKQKYYWLKEEKLIVLHVRHAFLNITLPYSSKQQGV